MFPASRPFTSPIAMSFVMNWYALSLTLINNTARPRRLRRNKFRSDTLFATASSSCLHSVLIQSICVKGADRLRRESQDRQSLLCLTFQGVDGSLGGDWLHAKPAAAAR